MTRPVFGFPVYNFHLILALKNMLMSSRHLGGYLRKHILKTMVVPNLPCQGAVVRRVDKVINRLKLSGT